jgi:hypothetical protein
MNVIKFPGYLVAPLDDRRSEYFHGCQRYSSFAGMVRDLSDRERELTTRWHVKREGRANYRAMVLSSYSKSVLSMVAERETGGTAA